MKITCIIHGNKKRSLESDLSKYLSGLDAVYIRTEKQGQAIGLTRDAIASGSDRILAVGGDGTLNEVIHGILSSSRPETPCLLYPAGTGNDWSRSFAPPVTPEDVRRRITSDEFQLIDAGSIRYTDEEGQKEVRHFINIADAGMGANVVRKVNQRSKWAGPQLTFFRAIAETFLTYRNTMVHAEFDNVKYDGPVRAIVIANGRFFGSGLCIAPDASPSDGLFSIVIIGDVSLFDYLRYLPSLRKGEFIHHPEVKYLAAASVRITSPAMMQIEADGEYLGFLPAQIDVLPAALRML